MNPIKQAHNLRRAVETLTAGPDRDHLHALARELETEIKYFVLREKAVVKGWKLPPDTYSMPLHSWVSYWLACAEHEKDSSVGRPIVPHRTGR